MNDIGQAHDETSPEGLTEWERIIVEDKQMIKSNDDAGWNWDEAKVTRTHPDDPDIHYQIDPATQEVILSAKLVEQVRGELKRVRRGDGR
jgi:hypothetical protein